jgi:hypothetical protein
MLETDQTPRPIAPGPPLLTAWRQVETLFARPLAAKRFGGWSSGKSQDEGLARTPRAAAVVGEGHQGEEILSKQHDSDTRIICSNRRNVIGSQADSRKPYSTF